MGSRIRERESGRSRDTLSVISYGAVAVAAFAAAVGTDAAIACLMNLLIVYMFQLLYNFIIYAMLYHVVVCHVISCCSMVTKIVYTSMVE